MHIGLTDRMFCPQCGPEFGLILLVHDVRDRRVLEGALGCSACRVSYPVRGGFADLRLPPRDPISDTPTERDPNRGDSEEVLRLGALLGVTEGPATLLIEGPEAGHARALADLVDGVEIVTLEPALQGEGEASGVSRMVASERLPFFSSTFRGILLSGTAPSRLLEEATRVLAPNCRLVILGSSAVATEELTALGLTVLLDDHEALVAEKKRSGSLPLLTLRAP
jgi:hypothetical protein